MAQQIITLAKQETSMEILDRVKSLELSVQNVTDVTNSIRGGARNTMI